MNYKQVIIVRQDLKMPKGKTAAMCSHASVESVLKSSKAAVEAWHSQGMPKIIAKVQSLRELLELKKTAIRQKLVISLITDSGRTFFKEPTITCLSIGPDEEEKIDKVTKYLKIL